MLALASDGALTAAIGTALGARRFPTTSELSLNYIRPPAPEAEAVIVRSQLVHEWATQALSDAGGLLDPHQRLAVVHVEIAASDNRPAVLADASVLLLPGVRWSDLAGLTDEPHELAAAPSRPGPLGVGGR